SRNATIASRGCKRGVAVLPRDEAKGEFGVAGPVKHGSGRSHARLRLATLLAGVSLSAVAAHAQNATWSATPSTNDWNTSANWTPATVPTNTARFGPSTITSVAINTDTSINTMRFNAA